MKGADHLKLRIWAPNWGLPSIDPDCLTVLAYSKFTNAPLAVEEVVPKSTVTGCLPELLVEESVFSSPTNIISIFRREQYNADFKLDDIQQADTLAYSAMVEDKLRPGLQSCLWLNSANYINVTRKALVNSFGFVNRHWELPHIRNKIIADLQLRTGLTTDIEDHWRQEAKICITQLSKHLGNSEFFFGFAPTTFDAIAFGHLAVLLKAPLVNTELKNHLLACDNLCKFCGRISQRYFREDGAYNMKETQKQKDFEGAPDEEYNTRSFKLAIAVAVAVNYIFLLNRLRRRSIVRG